MTTIDDDWEYWEYLLEHSDDPPEWWDDEDDYQVA